MSKVNSNQTERKVTIRFRTKQQRFIFSYLESLCNQKGENLGNYLINVLVSHAEELMKKNYIPEFTSTLYGVTRKAIYAGTVGQNVYTAKTIKPVLENTEITDLKLNFIINILLNQIKPERYKDIQRPPDSAMEELTKFSEFRKVIDRKLTKNIASYINQNKNVNFNNQKFVESVSFEEYSNSIDSFDEKPKETNEIPKK